MDLSTLASSLQATLGAQLPGILGALGILIIGWLVAVTARAGTRRLLAMLSRLPSTACRRASGEHTTGLARIARLAILGLVIAMGLRAMGIADDIVNLAFGLTLGAIAVAFALSFGLGGREAAGRQMEHWLSRLRKGN
jgi:Conserved TM helix